MVSKLIKKNNQWYCLNCMMRQEDPENTWMCPFCQCEFTNWESIQFELYKEQLKEAVKDESNIL